MDGIPLPFRASFRHMDASATPPPPQAKPVERLFPFVLRSRALIVGRDTIARSKSKLHFILITTDLSEASRKEILTQYSHYPVLQHYTSADLETFFKLKATKVIAFQKSGLAKSIYAELKEYRLNQPAPGSDSQKAPNPTPEPPSPVPASRPRKQPSPIPNKDTPRAGEASSHTPEPKQEG